MARNFASAPRQERECFPYMSIWCRRRLHSSSNANKLHFMFYLLLSERNINFLTRQCSPRYCDILCFESIFFCASLFSMSSIRRVVEKVFVSFPCSKHCSHHRERANQNVKNAKTRVHNSLVAVVQSTNDKHLSPATRSIIWNMEMMINAVHAFFT